MKIAMGLDKERTKAMILIFEQDTRTGPGRSFWKPSLFKGPWKGKTYRRFGWGNWSLSYYPSPGARDFFEHIEKSGTQWFRPEDCTEENCTMKPNPLAHPKERPTYSTQTDPNVRLLRQMISAIEEIMRKFQ